MHGSNEEAGRPAGFDPEVQWRRLDGRLWVGRNGQRTIGTIEHGSRYVYVDLEGTHHAGRPTLREAQDQATGPIDVVHAVAAASTAGGRGRRAVGELVVVIAVAVIAMGLLWSAGSLLYIR